MNAFTPNNWVYLDRKPGSVYRQLFIKGRNIAALTLYSDFLSTEEPRSLEQLAADYELPLEAVRKAITYCESNPPDLQQDWAAEEALEEATGMNDPDYRKTGRTRLLSLDEAARLSRF